MWKGQFPWLCNIQMRIRDQQSTMKLTKSVHAIIILHNLCMKMSYKNDIGDNEDFDSNSEDDYTADDG